MNHLQSSLLTSIPGVTHGFYIKNAGPTGETPLCMLTQIHSSKVVKVSQPLSEKPEADGIVTTTPHLAIGVRTADCVPLLLCDPKNHVIGAIHAGWRGALQGICEEAIRVMLESGATLNTVKAALGPSITQKSYEVGPEVYEQFMDQSPHNSQFFEPSPAANHFYLDLPGYVTGRLSLLGVCPIDSMGINTFEDSRFFSYRKLTAQGEPYGKRNNLSVIALDFGPL